MAERTVPHNLDAEESLVGAMLLTRSAIDVAMGTVIPEDFYSVPLRALFSAIVAMTERGERVDPVTLAAATTVGRVRIAELQAQTPASANAAGYAKIIVAAATRRRLIAAGERITGLGYDSEVDPGAAHDLATELLRGTELPTGGEPDLNVAEFIAEPHEYRWALPGLLEVMDRLLLVAPEKYGKSTLIRQMAVCASQGLDPFQHTKIPPCNVLLVDCENPPQLVRRKLRPLLDNCENTLHNPLSADRLRIVSRPEGIDITSRVDEYWLQERIEANMARWHQLGWLFDPFILCIGPIYKLHNAEDERAADARKVQRALDRIRTRYEATLVMETHAPHESFNAKSTPRSLRPAGSRVWLRWPEFCRGIEPAENEQGLAEFYDVQGARDERDWPYRLRRGGKWPWKNDPVS